MPVSFLSDFSFYQVVGVEVSRGIFGISAKGMLSLRYV